MSTTPWIRAAVAVCIVVSTLFAATPVARVSSPESFLLRGAWVPVEGVSNWPIAPGDELATAGSRATISFRDGASIIVGENSRLRVERSGAVRIVNGSAVVTAAADSRLRVYTDGSSTPVSVRPGMQLEITSAAGRISAAAPNKRVPPPPPPGLPGPVSTR